MVVASGEKAELAYGRMKSITFGTSDGSKPV